MSVNAIFRELAVENATKQTEMVDNLLEEAPFLAMMPMQPSTDGFSNVYEELSSVTGAGLVDIDDELPMIDSSSELKQTDLSILGGTMFVGEDKAMRFGGAGAYFNGKMPVIMNKTGEDLEKALIYNNFRAFAIDNNKVIDALGVGSTNYSMLAVTWKSGVISGLYDPTSYGNGKIFDVKPLNGGELYEKEVDGKIINGYGVRIKSTLGVQLASDRYISGIVNIDIANSKTPTEAQLDEMLLNCRANGATKIYMHPALLTWMYNFKGDRMQMVTSESNVDRTVAMWNGIPIVTTYSFLKAAESKVTV
ncbi:MAG: hypothetical protein GQ570_11800 [Helicobacteraceae bacterium]|nr:hypothetical protein [Helicobacteraceae bacterium]